jgi:1L-myo-inositol 1-phosphate cytidylyltransferase / CDP-L-myo-inositol myo-inositolphosphotransferase
LQTSLNGFINKALIIAAGQGSRLHSITNGNPKPLTHLLGLSLIERVMFSVKEAGVNDFVMVVGYLGDKIKAKLGDGTKYGAKITYVENDEWQKGNGISVLKAKELLNKNIKEKFFLLMSDHIFEYKVLQNLKKMNLGEDNCALVVDKTPKEHIDLDEATKVRIENGHIIKIGKNLEDYNGVDCGIFLLTPSIFEALEESRKNGDETLSGGIRILGENGKVKTLDIKDGFWIDVDTENDYLEAKKILVKKLIQDNASWNRQRIKKIQRALK